MLFSIFQSIAAAFAITVENYTGIWIPQRDVYPFAVIACENLSNNTKYSVNSTLQCIYKDPWKELTNMYIVYDDWIANDRSTTDEISIVGKYNVDGEIELFKRSTNGYERIGKWQRTNVRDYIGVWELVSERSKESSDIHCKKISQEQLACIMRKSKEGKWLTYSVRETSITNNANSSLQGMFNRDGSISWFLDTNYFLTWKRKGKFLQCLWNRAMKSLKHKYLSSINQNLHFLRL